MHVDLASVPAFLSRGVAQAVAFGTEALQLLEQPSVWQPAHDGFECCTTADQKHRLYRITRARLNAMDWSVLLQAVQSICGRFYCPHQIIGSCAPLSPADSVQMLQAVGIVLSEWISQPGVFGPLVFYGVTGQAVGPSETRWGA